MINDEFFQDLGVPPPTEDSMLTVYEDIKTADQAKLQAKAVPSPVKVDASSRSTTMLPHGEDLRSQDWFVLSALEKEDSIKLDTYISSFKEGETELMMRWVQQTKLRSGAKISTIFKSRVYHSRTLSSPPT